ncbi:c-type cytochrome [Vibrio sp.]|nr:c-type cytochrome [Vibrio sp.]
MNKVTHFFLAGLFVSFSTYADDFLSGGDTTIVKSGPHAFSQPASNLPLAEKLDFSVGNSFFRNPWVPAPSSTTARDGLGPLFNTNGCQNCHIKDGRGHAPKDNNDLAVSMLVRMSVPVMNEADRRLYAKLGVVPEPNYGDQLQDFAVANQVPEGRVHITYSKVPITLSDGEIVSLRKPTVTIIDLGYGPLHPQTMLSARIAPPMIGLGLLEAIPEETLRSFSDPDDKDGDGISGKLNRVWNFKTSQYQVGRFGWKAGQPTLMQQNAAAFSGDVGLTSTLFPNQNCSQTQSICTELPHGGEPEVSDRIMRFIEFYSQHLAVPSRRNIESKSVILGKNIFNDAGCSACHRSNIKTGNVKDRPALSNQVIHPYTDLLLHDMGDGLSDHRPEAEASGSEWRTPPLWGIGYTKEVSQIENYLHDGRARTLLEAILWHGGEAEPAKQAFIQLSKKERDALIDFLNSL